MQELLFWAWIILALIFLIAEIFTVSFFISCFAVGSFAAALVAFFFPATFGGQMGAFLVGSGVALALSRSFADRITGRQTEEFGVDRLIGKRGIVIEAIDSVSGRGRIRVNREEWRADVPGTLRLEVGQTVEVIEVDGTHLVVRSISDNLSDRQPALDAQ